jgi:hypothetical protein
MIFVSWRIDYEFFVSTYYQYSEKNREMPWTIICVKRFDPSRKRINSQQSQTNRLF